MRNILWLKFVQEGEPNLLEDFTVNHIIMSVEIIDIEGEFF